MSASRPRAAVWEVTLRCDQRCPHCGSDAGAPREKELSSDEAVDVARQLGTLGVRHVTLIGGEAYLREDLERIVAALAGAHVLPTLQTGGRTLRRDRIAALQAAGLAGMGFSIEGTEAVHDAQRGWKGSLAAALAAMDAAVDLGLPVTVNTQLNTLNVGHLREILELVRDHRAWLWHLQLTVPTGRAQARPDLLLQPWQVVDVIQTAAALKLDAVAHPRPWETRFDLTAGDDLGYFGPHEETLRSRPGTGTTYWQGCQAGCLALGVLADGTVKPCASMVMPGFVGGNVRDRSLQRIWDDPALGFRRSEGTSSLWGFCASCYYAEVCQGGCTSTTHAFLGRHGNNPFCYHRVETHRARGIREILEPTGDPARPFRIVEVPCA